MLTARGQLETQTKVCATPALSHLTSGGGTGFSLRIFFVDYATACVKSLRRHLLTLPANSSSRPPASSAER